MNWTTETLYRVLATFVNLQVSLVAVRAIQRLHILRRSECSSYGRVEKWVRVYGMIGVVIAVRHLVGLLCVKTVDRFQVLRGLQQPQLKSNIFGASAFLRPFAADIFSYLDDVELF